MSNSTIKYEIKLQPSVIVILGILAVGVGAIAFAPMFSVKKADAAFGSSSDGMITVAVKPWIWQLTEGKVRYCSKVRNLKDDPYKTIERTYKEEVECTPWKE